MMFFRSIAFFLLISGALLAQSVYTKTDVDVCNSKFRLAVDNNLKEKPINEIIEQIGKSFIGLGYEASALDKSDTENLVVHLTGLDCYTFLENTLVLSRCVKSGNTTFNDYLKGLENIRYRNGKMDGYASRLHYFTDWIYDCGKRGIVKDITKELGGIPYKKEINFMSTHPASYRQLKDNPTLVNDIKAIEKNINSRKYYYIPKESVAELEKGIKSGDLIAITTSIEGLDVSHVGIAVREKDGRIHFMHSPSPGKKIQITPQPLSEYLAANKKQTGIMVIRAEDKL